jgi:hypothetical protein
MRIQLNLIVLWREAKFVCNVAFGPSLPGLTRLRGRGPFGVAKARPPIIPLKSFRRGRWMDTQVKSAYDASSSSRGETDLPVCPVLTRKIFRFFIL